VPIGLARSPFVVFPVVALSRENRPDSGVSTPPPLSASPYGQEKILSQALAPLQSFTNAHRNMTHLPPGFHARKTSSATLLLPRFGPLQRFANRGELPNSSKIPTCRLRCVLRVSHPLDALLPPRPAGFVSPRFRSWGLPFEVLLLQATPYALSSAATLMQLVLFLGRTSTSGLSTQPRVPTTGPVFSRGTASDTSLGFSPSEASCQSWLAPMRR
jgi:hypothetical protein